MAFKLVLVGVAAGITGGLFGIGGGTVMVPMLVFVASFDQHRSHATSLAAGVVLAAVGGATYALAGDADYETAIFLAVGGLVGAPLGARLMKRTAEGPLKVMFGIFLIGVAVALVVR